MGGFGDIRRERLDKMAARPDGPALEIGPLADPILRRGEHDVYYLDVFDREGLAEHYGDDASVDCEAIPEIDFTLSTPLGVQTLAEAASDGAPYDYVVASHVIEHVPDVIGWLADVATLLRDDGLLMLVVPDRRYCFDYYRHQTSVGQMLQAADSHDRSPSVRAVYDHLRNACTVDTAEIWRGLVPNELESVRIHDLAWSMGQVDRARAGEYIDSHVWTFTPETFVEQVQELGQLGLCDFEFEAVLPTPENFLEFYIALRRLPRGLDESAKQRRVAESAARAREAARFGPVPLAPDRPDVAGLQRRLQDVEAEVLQLRRELAAVKSSERWRVGGFLAGPPSWLRERVHPSTRNADR
ncbi:MAG: class I SAM-dependent methyltransferase [Dermatophilaceae bacterium]